MARQHSPRKPTMQSPPIVWNFRFFVYPSTDRSQLNGNSSFIFYDQTLLCSPPVLVSSFSYFFLLAETSTLTPAPFLFAQQPQNSHVPSAPVMLGETPFSVAAAKRGPTTPAPALLDHHEIHVLPGGRGWLGLSIMYR